MHFLELIISIIHVKQGKMVIMPTCLLENVDKYDTVAVI